MVPIAPVLPDDNNVNEFKQPRRMAIQ